MAVMVLGGSSWTNKLIESGDHAAVQVRIIASPSHDVVLGTDVAGCVQINIGNVDPATGRYTGTFRTFAFCGALRRRGESDMALNKLLSEDSETA